MKKYIPMIFFTLIIYTIFPGQTHALENDTVELLLIQGDYGKVINQLVPLVTREPGNITAQYHLGLAYQGLNKHDRAIEFLKLAEKSDNKNIKILLAFGNSYSVLGMYRDAEYVFKRILELDQYHEVARINLAKVYYNSKLFEKAYNLYKDITQSDTTNSYFLKQLGLCAMNLDSAEQSIHYFKRAQRFNDKDLNTYIHLYNLYFKGENFDSALTEVNRGLVLYPENLLLRKAKAELLFKTLDYLEAIELYQGLLTTGDSSINCYKKLGMCYYYTANYSSALLALGIAFNKDSTDVLVSYYYGLTHKKINNFEKAIKLINNALEHIIPDYLPDLYEDLAESYDKAKKFPEAIRAYKKVLELDENSILALFFLASLYERYYADAKVALDYYTRFVDRTDNLYPTHLEYAKDRINKLKEKLHFQDKK
jgi:tetratricopeptide (TPR) repeat protein